MSDHKFAVRNLLFNDEDRVKDFKEGSSTFKFKALFPIDQRRVAQIMAGYQLGMPASSFTNMDLNRFDRDATIEVALLEHPEWWEGVDKCPDEDLVNRLHAAIVQWTKSFQDKLKKNQLTKRSAESAPSP